MPGVWNTLIPSTVFSGGEVFVQDGEGEDQPATAVRDSWDKDTHTGAFHAYQQLPGPCNLWMDWK